MSQSQEQEKPIDIEDRVPQNIFEALLALQEDAPKLTKEATAKIETKGGGSYSYKYLKLQVLHEEVLPRLSELRLLWTCRPSIASDGSPALSYALTHVPSHTAVTGEMKLMVGGSGGPRDQGSGITYARRYALLAVLGLAPDDDDDGAMPERQAAARKIPKSRARALFKAAEAADGVDRLQRAASFVHRAEIGKCGTLQEAEKSLVALTTAEAAALMRKIEESTNG